MEKQIRAAASMGAKELIGVTANFKPKHDGYFLYDRFRTDVTWEDQLLATEKFLKLLAPVLRETGTRINLETHDEITSFEILRLIEAVGDDVLGVAFDTCNVLSIGEDPMAVVKRTAPYIHQMHAKDFIVFFTDNGLTRQVKPCGQGVVDFEEIFREIAKYNPKLQLQVEDHKGYMPIDIYVKEWVDRHPDLQLAEVSAIVRYAYLCQKRIAAGQLMEPEAYEAIDYWEQRDERLNASRDHLFSVLDRLGLRE
ncbi:TIM barrel protein [Paenibacillus sp. CECT 9249]|nr:TIM barrel protein [Paenibacillus sp. CECT 9249]